MSIFPVKSCYQQPLSISTGVVNPASFVGPFPNNTLSCHVTQANQASLRNPSGSSQSQSLDSKKRFSKWQAAKAGIANSWPLGLPFGLAAAALMHQAREFDPSEAQLTEALKKIMGNRNSKPVLVALNLASALIASITAWALYGGIIGSIYAAVANRKLNALEKQEKLTEQNTSSTQGNPLNGHLNPHKVFLWGAGLSLFLDTTLYTLEYSGLLGKSLQGFVKALWQKPKLRILSLLLLTAESITNGYLATRMVPWMQQQLNTSPNASSSLR